MSESISALSESNFDEEVKTSDVPVLIDFWAEWCGPCRTLTPVLEEIAGEKSNVLKVVKVNVDENPALQQRFEVMSIPTLLLFKDGEQTDLRIVGAKAKASLLQEIQPYLTA
jgi:thioredoxin 1